MKKFLPIILGSDENAYGCARMFYEINGEKSLLMCSRALLSCDNSGILTRRVIKDFDTDPVFGSVMKSVLSSLRNEAENLILISCSDYYAELVVNNAEMIRKYVASPILSEEVYRKICGKIRFAKLLMQGNRFASSEDKGGAAVGACERIIPGKIPGSHKTYEQQLDRISEM